MMRNIDLLLGDVDLQQIGELELAHLGEGSDGGEVAAVGSI